MRTLEEFKLISQHYNLFKNFIKKLKSGISTGTIVALILNLVLKEEKSGVE